MCVCTAESNQGDLFGKKNESMQRFWEVQTVDDDADDCW